MVTKITTSEGEKEWGQKEKTISGAPSYRG